jgi:hypothetical protein
LVQLMLTKAMATTARHTVRYLALSTAYPLADPPGCRNIDRPGVPVAGILAGPDPTRSTVLPGVGTEPRPQLPPVLFSYFLSYSTETSLWRVITLTVWGVFAVARRAR